MASLENGNLLQQLQLGDHSATPTTFAVVKNDDDTKRTALLCEEDETDHQEQVCGEEDEEASEISSLGGLEDGFDIHESLKSLEEGASQHFPEHYDDDDSSSSCSHSAHSTGVPTKVTAAQQEFVSPLASPDLPAKPSFNAFLEKRKSTLEKNMDFLQGQMMRKRDSHSNSNRSFVEDRIDTFSKNIHFLLGASSEDESEPQLLPEEEEQPPQPVGFFQARLDTFSRNIETISSHLRNNNG